MIKATLDSFDKEISFLSLDVDSLFKAVFVDAGFASNPDSLLHIGSLITLMDNYIH